MPLKKDINGDIHLALFCGDDSVACNQLGEDTTSRLNTLGKCSDINKNDSSCPLIPREDTSLDSSTICNSLIRVDTLGRLFAEKLLEELLDLWDTGGTSDQDNLNRQSVVR